MTGTKPAGAAALDRAGGRTLAAIRALAAACLILASVLPAACGSSASGADPANSHPDAGAPDAGQPDAGQPGGGAGCTMSLSGAITGTLPCVASAFLDGSTGATTFGVVSQGGGTVTQADGGSASVGLYVNVAFPGALQAQTYTTANTSGSGASASITSGSSGQAWAQSWDGVAADTTGTFSLTVSDVGPVLDNNGSKTWSSPRGSYSATLPASPAGAGAAVNLGIRF